MFRVCVILSGLVLWMLLFWMGTHLSSDPRLLGRYSPSYAIFLMGLLTAALSVSLAAMPPLYSKVYRARSALVAVTSSLAISLLLAEVFVRLADPLGISYYEEAGRYHLEKVADEQLVYKHRSLLDSEYQGVAVSTNSLGLRDTELSGRAADELRIVALGDSVTFGWGVQQTDIFSERLEALAAERAGEFVNVINTGVGSYNTSQQQRFFARNQQRLSPDAVILVYVSNDVEVAQGPFDPWSERFIRGKSPPEQATLLLGHSWLYRMVAHVARFFRPRASTDVANSLQGRPGFEASMDSLTELAEECNELDIPFIVFLFRYERSPLTDELLEAIDSRGDAAGFDVYDMQPWFEALAIGDFTNSVVDTHPNSEGHRLIAEGIFQVLQARGVL